MKSFFDTKTSVTMRALANGYIVDVHSPCSRSYACLSFHDAVERMAREMAVLAIGEKLTVTGSEDEP